jgi:hypothetical protein
MGWGVFYLFILAGAIFSEDSDSKKILWFLVIGIPVVAFLVAAFAG